MMKIFQSVILGTEGSVPGKRVPWQIPSLSTAVSFPRPSSFSMKCIFWYSITKEVSGDFGSLKFLALKLCGHVHGCHGEDRVDRAKFGINIMFGIVSGNELM